MVFQTENALKEVGDSLDASDKAAVEADLNTLKEAINRAPIDAMTEDQVNDIKTGKEKLMESAQKLFAKVYEKSGAQGATGAEGAAQAGGEATGSSSDDDVIDADYKEV